MLALAPTIAVPPRRRPTTDLTAKRRRAQLRLLNRIHRRYATTTAPVALGPLTLNFTRIANPDTVLDEVAAEEDRRDRLANKIGSPRREPQHLPYWAEVWDSANGLGTHLATSFADLANQSVFDLGCGQGLSGCTAAALGANVLFADLESPSLLFAKLNSLHPPTPNAQRPTPLIRTRQLNWQTDHLNECFDLILGADILYDRHQWPHLDPFFKSHLANTGQILLAEPHRPSGDQFIPWITARGWTLHTIEQPIPTRPTPIRIFQLTLHQK